MEGMLDAIVLTPPRNAVPDEHGNIEIEIFARISDLKDVVETLKTRIKMLEEERVQREIAAEERRQRHAEQMEQRRLEYEARQRERERQRLEYLARERARQERQREFERQRLERSQRTIERAYCGTPGRAPP